MTKLSLSEKPKEIRIWNPVQLTPVSTYIRAQWVDKFSRVVDVSTGTFIRVKDLLAGITDWNRLESPLLQNHNLSYDSKEILYYNFSSQGGGGGGR